MANMRFAVAICFLVAVCIIDASLSDNLEILRIQVRDAKWNVESIIRQLQLVRSQAEEDIVRKVSEKWDEEQDSHRSYKNLLITGIKKDVKVANASGKNVDSCYKEALDGIETSENTAYSDASKCNDDALNLIESNLGFIDNLISTGNELSIELDDVFTTCYDSDILKMQSCIVTELAKINNEIRTLNSDTNSAEITIVYVSNNVILKATNCLKKAYSLVYSAGVTIKMRFSQCIEEDDVRVTTKATTTTTKKSTTNYDKKYEKLAIFNHIPYFQP